MKNDEDRELIGHDENGPMYALTKIERLQFTFATCAGIVIMARIVARIICYFGGN